MPFCPACGNQVADTEGTRFCPRCGRDLTAPAIPGQASAPAPERPPAPTLAGAPLPPPPPPPPAPHAAPTAHLAVPPPRPPYGTGYPPPAPAGPSPVAAFARRVVTGRWPMPVLVALGPALTVLAVALVMAGAAGAALPGGAVGMATRTRAALAVLIQGLGGNLTTTATIPSDGDSFDDSGDDGGDDFSDGGGSSDGGFDYSDGGGDGGSDFSSGGDSSDGGSDGFDLSDGGSGSDVGYAASGSGGHTTVHSTFSVLPWTVSLLWVVVLVLGLRMMRTRRQHADAAAGGGQGSGADAAVQVALVAAAAALALGFAGQPHFTFALFMPVHVTTAPFLAAVWTFVLTLATALLVLCRPALLGWLAVRPATAAAYRVLGTAAIAVLATVTAAGAIVFAIALAHYDDLSGWGVTAAGLLLLNLGVSGLGLSWGAAFHVSAGNGTTYARHADFGLGDLDHVWGGWSVAGTVAAGIGCALLIGVLAVRRSHTRPEQFAVAGVFTGLFVVLVAYSGARSGGESLVASAAFTRASLSTQVPAALGFCLLWSFGGVLAGPYVWRALGGRTPPAVPAGPYPPGGYGPPAARAYGGQAPDGATYGGQAPDGATPGGQAPDGATPGGQTHGGPPYQPVPPPEPTVYDLGVVEPDRLRKEPPHHR